MKLKYVDFISERFIGSTTKIILLFLILFIATVTNNYAKTPGDEILFIENNRQFINNIRENTPVYFKDNVNTNYYLTYKTQNYLSVIKISIESVKDYKIAYAEFLDDRFRTFEDAITYIYKKPDNTSTFKYKTNISINDIASNIYYFKRNAEILMQNTDFFQKYNDKLYRIKTTYFEEQSFYMFDIFLEMDGQWILIGRFYK